jgi:dihydroorotase
MATDMVIRNGTIVLPDSSRKAHLIIEGEKIREITDADVVPEARVTIDAAGLYVLPGLIDPHVHFRTPGLEYKEDFRTGSAAAAAGGITCINDMPNVVPPTQNIETFRAKLECAAGNSFVDYGLYAAIVSGNFDQILLLAEAGIIGYKVYMGMTVGNIPAPSDGELIEAWDILRGTGLRCGVHAENNGILVHLREKLQKVGRRDPLAHVEARPAIAESECTSRAILFAEHCSSRLMIHHVSSREALRHIRQAKARGVEVMAETAPHYLLFESGDMMRRGLGSLLKINPPVRQRDDAEALWQGIADGTIDAIGSDHSPHTPEEKMEHDRFADIWKAASGFPGVETSARLMLTQVNEGRLTLNQYVKIQSEGPARAWNLWPRKGNLNPGADADVTIVDLAKEAVIDKSRLHGKSRVTPFDGWKVKGVPVYTIVRGNIVMKDGEVLGRPIGKHQRPV